VEAFVGVCDKLGIETGVDFFSIVDAAEDVVRPVMADECKLDRMR
jgi:4-hydroxy 2-oxovalerate aldolase